MASKRYQLKWVRENIRLNLRRVDGVIAEIVGTSLTMPALHDGEPWVDRLFERRQGLQITLSEVERQIESVRV
jgi:hypothetical protein